MSTQHQNNGDSNNKLRVALVCDWLTEIGGAEQVLLSLTKIFPDAPIYTSQYRPQGAPWFKDRQIHTSWWLNLLPRGVRKFISPLRAIYFRHLKLSNYDVVISVCNAECKGVKTPPEILHISYLQGPPTQYYWGQYDRYIENPGFGKLNWLARLGLKILVRPMRRVDAKLAQRPDILVANSYYVLDEIRKYYGRDGEVIHPAVQVELMGKLANQITAADIDDVKAMFAGQDFYVIAGRQVNWKRFDLAVQGCARSGRNLLVIGDGPENDRLRQLAQGCGNIIFLPRYDGPEEISRYLAAARGFLFPSLEPFGIIPVEALASGCPVLALHSGGALDFIEEGVNGGFFDQQTVSSLVEGLDRFEGYQFKKRTVMHSAQQFAMDDFAREWLELINGNVDVGVIDGATTD